MVDADFEAAIDTTGTGGNILPDGKVVTQTEANKGFETFDCTNGFSATEMKCNKL